MFLIGGPNPVFNGGQSIGLAPQVRCFDVFYTDPVVAGLQAIGEDSSICPPNPVVLGLQALGDPSSCGPDPAPGGEGDCGC